MHRYMHCYMHRYELYMHRYMNRYLTKEALCKNRVSVGCISYYIQRACAARLCCMYTQLADSKHRSLCCMSTVLHTHSMHRLADDSSKYRLAYVTIRKYNATFYIAEPSK